jgi:hypothetical protein
MKKLTLIDNDCKNTNLISINQYSNLLGYYDKENNNLTIDLQYYYDDNDMNFGAFRANNKSILIYLKQNKIKYKIKNQPEYEQRRLTIKNVNNYFNIRITK